MSQKTNTIEGYYSKSTCGSIFDMTNTQGCNQSEIASDIVKSEYEEPVRNVKSEKVPQIGIGCNKDDDAKTVASFAKTDSDYDEGELRNNIKKDEASSNLVLMEDLLVIGAVPLMFFLPDCKMKQSYADLIERNGGLVVEFIECCVYQIYPEEEKEYIAENRFFKGSVYSSNWINDCIREGVTKGPQEYFKYSITENGQDINFSRTKFSIREVIKLFKAAKKYPSRKNKNPTYWRSMIEKQFFPGRSPHSLNNQWQRFSDLGDIEGAIRHALNLNMHYCINFKAIPNDPDIIQDIREELKSRSMYLKQLSVELENENHHLHGLSNVASHIISKTNANKFDQEIQKLLNSNMPGAQNYGNIKNENYTEIGAQTSRCVSEVDPMESKALGGPPINFAVEEGNLVFPVSQIKSERKQKLPEKNKIISYLDIPLKSQRDSDCISTSSQMNRMRVSKGRSRKRSPPRNLLIPPPLRDIDRWERQSYAGPTFEPIPDLLGPRKRMKLEENMETLSRCSIPDITAVIERVEVGKGLQFGKDKNLTSLASRFDNHEEAKAIKNVSDDKLQMIMIEIPSLHNPRLTRTKSRIIHDVNFEKADTSSKESIIKSLNYMLKTYTSLKPNELEKQLETSKKDLYNLNGDLKRFEYYLKGEKVPKWTPLEDFIARNKKKEDSEFEMLVKDKGEDEVERRKEFLSDKKNIFKELAEEVCTSTQS